MSTVLYRAAAGAGRAPFAILREPDRVPTTGQLLVEGGDARIALDPHCGTNRYGCAPFPDSGLAAFGSSTASVISEAAFRAADRLRDRLADTPAGARAEFCELELARMRLELTQYVGTGGRSAAEIVFAASGTDVHLIAACLARSDHPLPPLVIMVAGAETGAGVPAAVAGCHFSTRSAWSSNIAAGSPVGPDAALPVMHIALRGADGAPLAPDAIDAAVVTAALRAAARGRRVLVVVNDLTKTGMLAPTPACAAALRAALPGQLEVLVDACQFRVAPSTVRAYLGQGFMVAVTGSKFLGGPSFSGALLVPQASAEHYRHLAVGRLLSAYSARSDWPYGWRAAASLPQAANPGLMLRWEAALAELRALRAVPEVEIGNFLRRFAAAIAERLADQDVFRTVPVPEIDRRPLAGNSGWDSIPTIFPFRLRRSNGGAFLNPEEMQAVYRLLQADLAARAVGQRPGAPAKITRLRCQLGQPVVCGNDGMAPFSVLRLSVGARQITAATRDGRAAGIIEEALAALDKTAWLAQAGLLGDGSRLGRLQQAQRRGLPRQLSTAATAPAARPASGQR
ncbi:MAG: hypothetical protein M0Z84_07215 [Gammaproteobacteria bacterium]|nr:hypothetical protein [Gammaproteobacteria bacterium]